MKCGKVCHGGKPYLMQFLKEMDRVPHSHKKKEDRNPFLLNAGTKK